MLGSNPSACQVSEKGRDRVTGNGHPILFSTKKPFGEIKAINPGVWGSAPNVFYYDENPFYDDNGKIFITFFLPNILTFSWSFNLKNNRMVSKWSEIAFFKDFNCS